MEFTKAQQFAALFPAQRKLLAALDWHLRCNHNPPVPISFAPVCIQAIEFANEGEWDALILLPPGHTRNRSDQARTKAIIEEFSLHSFLDQEVA